MGPVNGTLRFNLARYDRKEKQMTSNTRLLIVQYAGDYREAVQRFAAGGAENYASQRYSVESVSALVSQVSEVSVLVCLTEEPYNELLSNGVRGIGAGFQSRIDNRSLLSLVERQRPTDLILCTPHRGLLRWATRRQVRTLALLADSFRSNGFRSRIRNWRLAKLFNCPHVEWVANHNTNSSYSLQMIGVNANKIIPWDWVSTSTPDTFSPKELELKDTYSLFYAGAIDENKGVGDLVRALALLNQRGFRITARIAGKGDIEPFKRLLRGLGVENKVEFLGMVPNEQVIPLMREADAVVIPSRHAYPEGLPMTIYEALCSRTPIVASDHPMFAGKLRDRESALVFPASQAAALAESIAILFADPDLYFALSRNSLHAWQNIQIPVKFGDSAEDREWFRAHSLAAGLYDGSAIRHLAGRATDAEAQSAGDSDSSGY
jgi:glycosyltransferase involved in cell wall biosynthesis